MQHVLGVVTTVQDGRFRLTTLDGQTLQFAQAWQTDPAAPDISALCVRMVHVRVGYDAVEGAGGLVARDIREMGMR